MEMFTIWKNSKSPIKPNMSNSHDLWAQLHSQLVQIIFHMCILFCALLFLNKRSELQIWGLNWSWWARDSKCCGIYSFFGNKSSWNEQVNLRGVTCILADVVRNFSYFNIQYSNFWHHANNLLILFIFKFHTYISYVDVNERNSCCQRCQQFQWSWSRHVHRSF